LYSKEKRSLSIVNFTSKCDDQNKRDESSAKLEDYEAGDGNDDDGSGIVPESAKEGTAGKLFHPDRLVSELVLRTICPLLYPSLTRENKK
jgi:hypothetical protein